MARFAEKYMTSGNNISSTVGSNEPDVQTDSSSFVAAVTKIFPDKCLATIDSAFMGKDAVVPYYPECGIREGGAVLVSVASNVPRITHVLDFGCDNSAMLDPLGEEKDGEFFSHVNASSVGNVAEKANGFATTILHKDGEKVFACEFSGLKAGITSSVLFYEANARVVVADGIVSTYANNIVLFSDAGTVILDSPKSGSDMGVKTESIFRIKGSGNAKTGTEVFKEYKGNVESGLLSDKMKIFSFPGSDIWIDELVYLMLIIDEDISNYKQSATEVTHTYIDRKLSVKGGGSSEVLINADFAGKQGLGLTQDDLKYSAVIVKRGSRKVALTYIKAISKGGDMYEFSAGESCVISNELKTIAIKERKDFMMGDYTKSFQANHREIQFPTSEKSVIHEENFGNNILEIKGNANHIFYRYGVFRRINTFTIHEVDIPSGIQTKEASISPVIEIDSNNIHTLLREHDDIDKPVETGEHLFRDGASLYVKKTITGDAKVMISAVEGTKKSNLRFGTAGFIAITSGKTYFKSSTFLIESENNGILGVLTLLDGLNVAGNLYIDATNIYLSAEYHFRIIANDVWINSEKTITMEYKDYFLTVSNNEGVDANGDPKMASRLWMDEFNVYIHSEGTQLYGDKFMYALADENAAFGAEHAIFYGGQ